MVRTILLLLMTVLLGGCARPTEEQRLAKFRGSMRYKAYCFASEKTARLAVTEYNKTGAQPVDEATIHAMLGVLWFLAEKSEYSYMEAEVAAAVATNDAKRLSLGLQSIALAKMKYPNLSQSYYDDLKAGMAMQQGIDTNRLEVEHKVMLLSLMAVSLYHGDPDVAKFGADGLSAVSHLDYLPPLMGAIVEAKKGRPVKAVMQLRELSQNEQFSEHRKFLYAEVADILASCPDKEKLGDEVMNRIVTQLVRRVLDDVFAVENQRALLEKVRTLPDLITGTRSVRTNAVGDAVNGTPVEK